MSHGPRLDSISFSQVSKNCGYQLWLYRLERDHREGKHARTEVAYCRLCLGLPEAPEGIALIAGSAVHAGIERWLVNRDRALARETADRFLTDRIAAAETGRPIRWDDAPRLRKDGKPYSGDEGRIPDADRGREVVGELVETWIERFGLLGALDVEAKVEVDLGQHHPELRGWKLTSILDVPTDEEGVVDIKTAGSPWKQEEIDSRLDQAHLYHLAYEVWKGHPASYFTFHVGLKGLGTWDVIEVPYDRAAIDRALANVVLPTVRTIKANAYTANRSGWWHSEKFCDYWHVCPLGAAARGASALLNTAEVA